MREFAFVGAWALVAIAYANYETEASITYIAGIAALVLVVSGMVHGYQNRATNPMKKCMEYFGK